MSIKSGTRFGPYEIVERIGAGGMGEVWRATDTKLKRDVALKVLPAAFIEDRDRLARFQREAEILASLNHTNIAQVYGLETAGEQTAIVMELVAGPTLEDRIKEGPLPADEAMGIALQIVAALEAAHAENVVHRDLKPANIKVRDDGTVKVLDFGISKPIDASEISGGSAIATPAVTQTGVILGTAAYMSPEQARGKFVDQRTDIWAFGCLLFEMLTGQPAFGGEDVMLTLARVLANDTNLDSIPGTISPAVRQTIRLCLEKDPKKRIHHIGDVRLALDGRFESELPAEAEVLQAPRSFTARALPVAVGAVIAGAIAFVIAGGLEQAAAPESRPVYYQVDQIPISQTLTAITFFDLTSPIAVSPDGTEYVYAGENGLMRRRSHESAVTLIRGTENQRAQGPAYSPDGGSVVYVSNADFSLKRIDVDGGTADVVLEDFGGGAEPYWADDGMIYFNTSRGMFRVPDRGGESKPLFEDEAMNFGGAPVLLPDGDTLIFEQQRREDLTRGDIATFSLSSGERVERFPGRQPFFVAPDLLVYWEPALGIVARRFDPVTLDFGDAIPFADDVWQDYELASPAFSVGANGSLAYVRGTGPGSLRQRMTIDYQFARLDANGVTTMLRFGPGPYQSSSIAPDGQRMAVQIDRTIYPDSRANLARALERESQIELLDLAGDTEPTRFTFEGSNSWPAWSPDGEWIAFVSDRDDGVSRIYRKRADGTGDAGVLIEPGDDDVPAYSFLAFAPGERLAWIQGANTFVPDDIYIAAIPGGEPERLVGGDGRRRSQLSFSPRGDAFAYTEWQTPASEQQTASVPKIVIESLGQDRNPLEIQNAQDPVWAHDGDALVYTRLSDSAPSGDQIEMIDFVAESFALRAPRRIDIAMEPPPRPTSYLPDSDSWLVAVPSDDLSAGRPREIVVIWNWIEDVRARVPPIERRP
jgi:Tol biopolymer transport system component